MDFYLILEDVINAVRKFFSFWMIGQTPEKQFFAINIQ